MKNVEASVRARLKNLATDKGLTLQRLLTLYLQEGLLRRITMTAFGDNIVLKGGLLLYVHFGTASRVTKDIDLHGQDFACDTESVVEILTAASAVSVDDGLVFDDASVRAEPISAQEGVVGARGHITGYLASARGDLQIDVGCGDVITGGPVELEYPTLLDTSRFTIHAYSPETMLAEKLSSLVSIGVTNSRIRDVYDLYLLLVQERYNLERVIEAAANTFRNRGIAIPQTPQALTIEHWSSVRFGTQWNAYLRRIQRSSPTTTELSSELLPILRDVYSRTRELINKGQ